MSFLAIAIRNIAILWLLTSEITLHEKDNI